METIKYQKEDIQKEYSRYCNDIGKKITKNRFAKEWIKNEVQMFGLFNNSFISQNLTAVENEIISILN